MKKLILILILMFCLTGCSKDLNGIPKVGEKITLEVYGTDDDGNIDFDIMEKVSGTISHVRETEEYYYIYLEDDPMEYSLIK